MYVSYNATRGLRSAKSQSPLKALCNPPGEQRGCGRPRTVVNHLRSAIWNGCLPQPARMTKRRWSRVLYSVVERFGSGTRAHWPG